MLRLSSLLIRGLGEKKNIADSTFKIKKSLTIAFVKDWDNQTMRGTAANHVKMKLNGSGSCMRKTITKSMNEKENGYNKDT